MSAETPSIESRITSYLTCGGMLNPELANHDAVSELLFDCREALTAAQAELAALRTQLITYGRHLDSCGDADAYNKAEPTCGCGFDAAIDATKG